MAELLTEVVIVRLTKGKVAIIDAVDAGRVLAIKWCAKKRGRSEDFDAYNSRLGMMSRYILGVTDPKVQVDHLNGDTLNNRRSNLEPKSHTANSRNKDRGRANTSGYVGVYRRRSDDRWRARIQHEGEMIHLGGFDTAEEAHQARLTKERELWGIQPRRAHHYG